MTFGIILGGVGLYLEPKSTFVFFLAALTLISLGMEIFRLAVPSFNHFSQIFMRPFLRDCEKKQMTGATYYLIGCTIAAIVFPRAIAVLSIFYLGLGDPVASLVGLKYGRKIFSKQWLSYFSGRSFPWAQKSLEGSLACFFVCFLATFFVTFHLGKTEHFSLNDRFLFSVLGGAAAMLGEFLPLRTDDNLSLPLISGAALWLSATVFHLLPGLYF